MHFQSESKDELKISDAIAYIESLANSDIVSVFKGFLMCGYDLDLQCLGNGENSCSTLWNLNEDLTLVKTVNEWCNKFHQKYSKFQAAEFRWKTSNLSPKDLAVLDGKTIDEVRNRLQFLKCLNEVVFSQLVPTINFDSKQGLHKDFTELKKLLFTSGKNGYIHDLMDATVEKNDDQPNVTVNLNPIENIEKVSDDIESTWFFQSYKVVSETPSNNFCIAMPSSDDPQYPMMVKMTGEEVQGNSGSFRQFMNTVLQEIHSASLPLLMPYMGNGPFKAMYMLRPGPLQILNQKLLTHLGQLIGMALRAGIPLPLGLTPHFWKSMSKEEITIQDLEEFDPDVESYLKQVELVPSQEEFEDFLEDHQYPQFLYQSITGVETELCSDGKNIGLNYDNRLEFVDKFRQLRKQELECREHMNFIVIGMSTLVPFQILKGVYTSEELQSKICGAEGIDLYLLKKYTIYQVGLSEDDRHIQDFWQALFSLSPKQQILFLKFACNQERIPTPESKEDLPPPFPMKIAPADAREEVQDNLLIRAETCIFMVKVPRYSGFEVMREKLIYSICSADDPLSG